MGTDIPLNVWQSIWSSSHRSSIYTIYRENAYKVMMYWYHTPELLHSLNQSNFNLCWRCESHVGLLYHIFWACPVASPFWRQITTKGSLVLNREIEMDPFTYLLGVPVKGLSESVTTLVSHVFTACRCLTAFLWRSTFSPTMADLYVRMQ